MTLSPKDFAQFWREMHPRPDGATGEDQREPFDWQLRLVDYIVQNRKWPEALDVPTGLGKTTTLDIAVFVLALARQGTIDVVAPRRIYLVIDRRVVVDQAFEHADEIATSLAAAVPGTVAAEVAEVLRPAPLVRHDQVDDGPHQGDLPLVAGRMRGGTTWAWRWLERPDQAAIIVGTIDQLGSRMLFDGYGVGSNLRPIDAALTGFDSLVLIDEAHLAGPFIKTLNDAQSFGQGSEPRDKPQAVIMSATTATATPFRIDEATERAHPVAKRRLLATKKLATAAVKTTRNKTLADTGKALAAIALGMDEEFDVVGVVANTVAGARQAFDTIAANNQVEPDDVVLITGRQRRIDRERLWERWRTRIEADRLRQPRRLYVVATQTIEVGADLDFTALVTESASIDALVQRLGRLNRRGDWNDSVAVVLHPSTVTEDDPIYGAGRLNTWNWLAEQVEAQAVTPKKAALEWSMTLDVSPLAADGFMRDLAARPENYTMARAAAPVLFLSTLQRWIKTSPRPLDAAPTGPFLHGLGRDLPSVNVAWRYGGHQNADAGMVRSSLRSSIDLVPVSVAETVEVPLWAFTKWWQGEFDEAALLADLTAVAGGEPETEVSNGDRIKAAIVINNDGEVSNLGRRAPANTTVVVPTFLGGLDQYGWAPTSTAEVLDVADLVGHRWLASSSNESSKPHVGRSRQERQVLRLGVPTLRPFFEGIDPEPAFDTLVDLRQEVDNGSIEDLGSEIADFLRGLLIDPTEIGPSTQLGDVIKGLLSEDRKTLADGVKVESPEAGLGMPQFLVHGAKTVETWSTDSTVTGTSGSSEAVDLDIHQEAVEARAKAFADALDLEEPVAQAVAIAARFHDCGKLDPRFQQMLNGGQLPPMKPLAKSGFDPSQRWRFAAAQRMSGYPSGMRHEAFSAKAVAELYADHQERDLIIHLVGAHHGRGRPLETAVPDPNPVTFTVAGADGQQARVDTGAGVDWDQPDRFSRLNQRFGPWRLAMLETIVRLADIGCSTEGS